MTLSSIDTNKMCQEYVTILYSGQQEDRHNKKNIAETYGEILYPSIDKLLSAISLTEQDIFLDLGSGIGKVVIQVFLTSCVKAAVGIEILSDQHQRAYHVAQRVRDELPEFYNGGRQLAFLQGDFFQLSLQNATVVFMNSICFDQTMLRKLGRMLNDLHHIHTILTTRPLPYLERFRFRKVVHVECSWDSALCYIYQSK